MPTEPPRAPAAPNAEQIALWNDVLVAKFTRHRRVMVEAAAVHSGIALRRHAVRAGERVLDVGCGFGETSLALARAVGPAGSVLGVDVCEPFLAVAREDARAAQLPQVTFRCADAQVEPFASEHDLVFSRFGAMFFQDPVAAFRNLRAALRTGGRLLMLVWRRLTDNEWAALAKKVVLEHLPPPPKPPASAPLPSPGPFSLSRPDVVRAILRDAGFGAVALEPVDAVMTVGQTIEEAVAFELTFGPAGQIVREAKEDGDAKRAAIERDLARALAPHVTPRGVQLGAASWCVTARA